MTGTVVRGVSFPKWWRALEDRFDLVSPALNPLRHLGSLAFLLFWILVATGVYLYAVIDTSVDGAYRSIDDLSRQQWWLGGVMRSVHRYAADMFALVTLAHLLREWVLGRFRAFATSSWLTGVALLPLMAVSAIGGFWLNWDQLGQYSAISSAEWMDGWPLFGSVLSRNFLDPAAVSDRLFSLFVFVHIGVPLLLLFGLWFHLRRLAQVKVWPPRPMLLVLLVMLLAMAAVAPVMSHPPANLATVPAALAIDWILLFVHPLVSATSATAVSVLVIGVMLLLLALPFWRGSARAAVAEVHPMHCSGCRRCVADCPYDAITMVPHPQRRGFALAEVDADACASCGICVGSCPSSTPFRSMATLVTGIDLPQQPIDDLRRAMRERLAAMTAPIRIVVFGCDQSAAVREVDSDDVAAFSFTCTGQLPPSFVEYALRDGASGVLVCTCPESGCAFRLGERWTAERLAGIRAPVLRSSVEETRWELVACAGYNLTPLRTALAALRRRLDVRGSSK
ncbi:MAG: hydrogenase iron-sulfur subunit [Rhodanobacteraceae bacterium]|nr:hydrogenase iron-sulfur subunit [Rhodanobacteraceae bacterium]MBP9153891.1 hydrogenase iron-sulfur subunit [Xanthomonadales bacterium]HQW82748.1 hydrogenase iron-sulfur subunit [Pseudomonadota bacterium]